MPEKDDLEPGYEQKHFGDERNGKLRLVASRDARDGSLKVHQDIDLYATILTEGERVSHQFSSTRQGWVQVARGTVQLNGQQLHPGDGAAISDEAAITIAATSDAEILLFDMAQ